MNRDKKTLFKCHEVRNTLAYFINTILDDFYRNDVIFTSKIGDPCFLLSANQLKDKLFRGLEFYVERDLEEWVQREETENNHEQ